MPAIENRTYTQDELERFGIVTDCYNLNLEPGSYLARFDLRATVRSGSDLRVFFTFEDGRKVLAVAKWFNRFLGLYEIPIGTQVLLTYTRNSKGNVFLTKAEAVE
jgi:hypothetical protein